MPSPDLALAILSAPALSLLLFALCWAVRPGLLGGFLANLTVLLGGAAFAWFALSSRSLAAQALLALLGIAAALVMLFGLYLLIVLLLLNSRVMLQRERPRLANMLTLLLALGLIALVALAAFDPLRWLPAPVRSFLGGCSLILPYLLFDAVNFLTAAGLCALHRPLGRLDYILVLGSGLTGGDQVPPLLAGRIERGLRLYEKQKRRGRAPKLLFSGGQGPDETVAEAQAMRRYALSAGVPEEDILVEDNSRSTAENLKFSKKIMELRSEGRFRCVFVSNGYHLLRASMIARRQGLRARGVGARTAAYYLPNALLREYIAVSAMGKRRHLAVCGIIALGSAMLAAAAALK